MSISPMSLSINQHDDKRFFFTLLDSDGAPLDPDDLTEIIFSIAPNITSASLMVRKKSLGDIKKSDVNEIYLDITSTESGAFTSSSMYCELRALSVDGFWQTLGAGSFTVSDTQIGDYP